MKRLLIIEPDVCTARQIAEYLGRYHTVGVVIDGQAAVHYLDEHTVDAIILEPLLPMHNGIEFLYEIRSYEDLQDVPVILYTAARHDQLAVSTRLQEQLNIDGIILKNHNSLSKLAHALREVETNAV